MTTYLMCLVGFTAEESDKKFPRPARRVDMRCNATNETEAMSTAIQKISHQYPDLEWLVAPTRAGYALPLDRSLDDAIIRDVG